MCKQTWIQPWLLTARQVSVCTRCGASTLALPSLGVGLGVLGRHKGQRPGDKSMGFLGLEVKYHENPMKNHWILLVCGTFRQIFSRWRKLWPSNSSARFSETSSILSWHRNVPSTCFFFALENPWIPETIGRWYTVLLLFWTCGTWWKSVVDFALVTGSLSRNWAAIASPWPIPWIIGPKLPVSSMSRVIRTSCFMDFQWIPW